MNKQRYKYSIIILLIIIAGLLSRQAKALPASTGDALYATMMYFIVKFFALKWKIKKVAIVSLFICFIIEFSQMYHATWIDNIRHTLPGRLILGQGFLWSDLLAYVVGVALACLSDTFTKGNK